jgi:excinuclease UvrABC nuclease subunit
MPFPKQNPREFTRTNVEAIKPNQTGVYGLFKQNRWIYIGRGDLRERLLAHFDGDNPCIAREGPTHYVDVVTSNAVEQEKKLIVEHNPICNRKVG